MITNYIESKLLISEKVNFRKHENCINCNLSNLYPVWQGKFADEPIRSFIQRCNYDDNLENLSPYRVDKIRLF